MSFIGTFFHKVEAVAKKLFGSVRWEQTAQSTITFVAPLLESIVQLTAGSGAENVVAKVISTVQADLSTISAVVEGGQTDAHGIAVVQTALGSIKTNLAGLLAVGEVKNSDKINDITIATNVIIGEVNAMLGALSQGQNATSSTSSVAA